MPKETFLKSDVIGLSIEPLFRKYYPRLCHFGWQMLNDKDVVEDLVQDAFIAYWNNKDVVANNDTAIKNFLYTSVRNASYNIIRHDKVAERYRSLHAAEEIEEPRILTKIIRSEVMDEIYRIMQTMPEGCRQVFSLGYLEEFSNPQIASQLGISINTVKTQKQRGLKILKGKLDPGLFSLVVVLLARR